jgi:protein-arginine deiminase
MQGEPLRVSTEWLTVGHVDEIVLAIPDQSGTGTYDWKLVIASPDLAIAALEELSADTENGYGGLDVFAGRSVETTVDGVLSDEEVMRTSELAQARIDTVQLRLMDALGLTEDDFLPVPVMYEYEYWDGLDLAYAYDPGIQNLIVADGVLFVPDPEGPDLDGEGEGTAPGVWQQLTLDVLEPTGHQVVFVDVFDSYHLLLGEAHCSANFQRQPYDQPWWEVAP